MDSVENLESRSTPSRGLVYRGCGDKDMASLFTIANCKEGERAVVLITRQVPAPVRVPLPLEKTRWEWGHGGDRMGTSNARHHSQTT